MKKFIIITITILTLLPQLAFADVQFLVWQNDHNVTIDQDTITLSSGSEGYATSAQHLDSGDGCAKFTAVETDTDKNFGFTTHPGLTDYTQFAFMVRAYSNGGYYVYQGTSNVVSNVPYSVNDVFKICYETGEVKLYKNDVNVYTFSGAPVYPVYVAGLISRETSGGTIKNAIVDFGKLPVSLFTSTVTGSETSYFVTDAGQKFLQQNQEQLNILGGFLLFIATAWFFTWALRERI